MPIIRRHRDRLAEHQRQALAQIGREFDVRYTTGPHRRTVDALTDEDARALCEMWPTLWPQHPLWLMQPCDRRRVIARGYRPATHNLGW